MKAATITEIKRELKEKEPTALVDICLRLARFKKDNKELLTYLLYESQNEQSYINSVKYNVDEELKTLNTFSVYYTKKGLRKILRQLDKNIRYSGNKETEADLRIYFCQKILSHRLPVRRSKVLTNLYAGQLKKINSAVSKLHEDLQFDYGLQIEELKAAL